MGESVSASIHARPGRIRVMKRSFIVPVAAGVLLHLYTVIFQADGGLSLFGLGLLAYSLVPYAVATALARYPRTAAGATGFATGALVGDLYMHYLAFIAPMSSTAALGLLVAPFWNLVLLRPVGAAIGWAVIRPAGRHLGGSEAR
jgi:hypothetical protein